MFAARDLALKQPCPAGYLDVVEYSNGFVRVAGWCRPRYLRLSTEMETLVIEPELERADVPAAWGARGFDVRICGCESLRIEAEGATVAEVSLAHPLADFSARLRTLGALATVPFRNRGDFLSWFVKGDAAAGRRLDALLIPPVEAMRLPAAPRGLFKGDDTQPPRLRDPVDIIVPVFNAWRDVAECLDRLARHTDPLHRIIVVDDASTEAEINAILDDFAQRRRNARILRNARNSGFIASVNRALSEATGHVVILNTDAFVPEGWLERLLAPILHDASVASVTPMTNNGEIANIPVICAPRALEAGEATEIDRTAGRLDPLEATAAAPTGVGFCMAMARKWLDLVPRFDPAFGQGYGEEVEWCQKVARRGGRHLLTGALFVEHRGGMSFGPEKRERIAQANALVSSRYPAYDQKVQNFIRTDPAIGPRLALGLACLGFGEEHVPVFLANRHGGGAEKWLEGQLKDRVGAGKPAIVVRMAESDEAAIIELHEAAGKTIGTVPEQELHFFLDALPQKEVVCSSLVGTRSPFSLIERIMGSFRPSDRLRILFHEYYPICPSYTLIGADGRYCDLPPSASCQACYNELDLGHAFLPKTVDVWRGKWRDVLERAAEIEVFSRSGRDLVARTWPQLADKIVVRPHVMTALPERLEPPANPAPVVGVLGAIGYEKGAAVLRDLASIAGDRLRIVVIGEMDMAYHHPAIEVHGRYKADEIGALARRYRIDTWLFPSICPETFSFAIRECLATGLPVFTFDLGAQAEAARAAPNGHIVPLGNPEELLSALLATPQENRTAAAGEHAR